VSEGLRFSQSVIEFKDIKSVDDFSIVTDNFVIDSEIPKHFQIKYYDLCRSQNIYLHENLLKGLNVKLTVEIILETVRIADAIRACKVTITRDDIATWDKTLKAFEEMGMKVGFLRARINQHQNNKNASNLQRAENMDIDLHQDNDQDNTLIMYDQSVDETEYADSQVSEGLRFSQSVIEFKDIKSVDDFSIV
nr:B3 domain-containing protein Os01g0234100-like [Tanacetum cinerariifolium]